jgi:hypothetical protein
MAPGSTAKESERAIPEFQSTAAGVGATATIFDLWGSNGKASSAGSLTASTLDQSIDAGKFELREFAT